MTSPEASECWLLLRGLGREAGHWGEFPEYLRAAFKPAQVHTLDLPGSGVHWQDAVPWSMQAMALQVREELQRRLAGPPRKCYLLAMSLGAMLAIEWLYRWPDDFDGAFLVNASVGGLSKPWERLRPGCWWPLVRTLLEHDPVLRERRIHNMTCNRAAPPAILEQRAEIYRKRPLRRSSFFRQLAVAGRYRLPPVAPRTPVLLLASRQDAFVNPRCSLALQRALGAELALHLWANHDLPYDDPQWIIEQIGPWRNAV